jgi:hypothetical protein
VNAKLPFLFVSVLIASTCLAGCGGGGGAPVAPLDLSDPAAFKSVVENPYFPIQPGTVWVYEGTEEGGFRHEEMRVLEEPRLIWGIACTGIREERFQDGDLAEVTTEWFAEDRRGNVWKFGEESIEFEGAGFERTADSWVVGEGDAVPWMMISARPAVGESYAGYRPGGQDLMLVESISASVLTQAGAFVNCLQILENPADPEDQDIILYAAGVGRVQEISTSGRIELVSISSP